MFSKTNLISTLVTAIWGYFGGWLLWGILGTSLMEGHEGTATGVSKEVPDHFHLIIGCFIAAFAFSTIYSKWARGAHSATNGFQFGLWLAILLALGEGLIDYSLTNVIDLTGAFINFVIAIVFYGIMGTLASLVYDKLSSSE